MSPLLAQMRSAAMSAIWSLSGEKRTSRTSRFFVDAEAIQGGPLLEVAWHGREAWRAAPGSAVAVSSTSFPHTIRGRCYCVRNLYATMRAHHARENQQCREGFSDHWPRRMARSR